MKDFEVVTWTGSTAVSQIVQARSAYEAINTVLGALKGEARTAFDGLECRVVGPWEEKPK